MQTINEIANLITNKNYLFEIVLPGKPYKGLKTTVSQAKTLSNSVSNYITNILNNNQATTAIIKLYSINGSSYKQRGDHIISLQKTEAVATNATNVATSATNVATNATNVATKTELGNLNDTKMLGVKETIEFEVLKVKHEMVTTDRDNLKNKVKELEKKVDDLQEEKLKLVKENGTAEERHKLALERQLLDTEKEAKQGLSGVLEEVNNNPEALKMILGIFKPDHPMFKNDAMGDTQQIQAPTYHSDKDAQQVLEQLPQLFKDTDAANVIYFFMVATEFVKEPTKILQVFNTIFPNLKK